MQNEKLILLTPNALEFPWGADDAAWFQNNPSRAHRVRPVYPDEFPPEFYEDAGFAVVRQIKAGVRSRIPIGPMAQFRNAPEHIAHAIFDLACNAQGGEFISLQRVNQRAAELRKAARVLQ
ncbi:MAG: hypothetical protein LAT78_13150 [Roseinatronobacter sp.]|jgi:hypothetical protein|nr:hypothetical protein [Roseinatronobacter sp.]